MDRPPKPHSLPSGVVTTDPDAEARDLAAFFAGQDPVEVAAAGWLVRRGEGLDLPAEAEFQAWLAADPAHSAALTALDGVWTRLAGLPADQVRAAREGKGLAPKAAATAPARQPAATASPAPAAPAAPVRGPDRSGRPWLPQLAGLGLALVAVFGSYYGWLAWQARPLFEGRYETARGQQREVVLPDGSRFWLDTATRAEVTLYRKRRELRLAEGQAQFAVHGDPARPFEIQAGPVQVTVVGTRFTVRHTHSGLAEGGVSVAVEEGRVRVEQVDHWRRELSAGEVLRTGPDGQIDEAVRSDAATAALWREGRVSFDGVPLEQALAEFERYGDTRFVITDPAVAALRINGSFDLRRLDAFIRALPQVLPVRLARGDGVTEIVARTSR